MRQFLRERFTFDGRRGEDFGLYICSVGGSSSTAREYGVTKSIKEEVTNNFIPTYQGTSYSSPTIQIQLCRINDKGFQVPFREEDNFEIIRWLFQSDDYKPFISHDNKDIIYYVQFTKGQNYRYDAQYGYLTLEMRLNSACAYSTTAHHFYRVSGEKTFDIMCKQNVEKYAHPDIEFQLNNNTTTFELINNTLGEEMRFTNLPPNAHVKCYNEGLKQIVVVNDPMNNIRKCFNKTWFRLTQGRNRVTIKGDFKVDISLQTKIAIQ